jgi:hypothetical protein
MESHRTLYTAHLEEAKLYQDLKKIIGRIEEKLMWPSVCPFLGFSSEGLVMRVWRDCYNPWRLQYGHGMTFDMIFYWPTSCARSEGCDLGGRGSTYECRPS